MDHAKLVSEPVMKMLAAEMMETDLLRLTEMEEKLMEEKLMEVRQMEEKPAHLEILIAIYGARKMVIAFNAPSDFIKLSSARE